MPAPPQPPTPDVWRDRLELAAATGAFVVALACVALTFTGRSDLVRWTMLPLFGVLTVVVMATRTGRRPERSRPQSVLACAVVTLIAAYLLGAYLRLDHESGESTRRSVCLSQMRQIGFAVGQYAQTHDGRPPPDLPLLIGTTDVGRAVFLCPNLPEPASEQGLRFGRSLSYVYLGGGTAHPERRDRVVMFEPLANHGGGGGGILWSDNFVEFYPADEVRRIVDEELAAGRMSLVEAAAVLGDRR